MRAARMRTGRRRFLGAALALALARCSSDPEPDDAAIRQAIERLHQDWVSEIRKNQQTQTPDLFRGLPNVNLAFEASLNLRITSVRKLRCEHPPGILAGYVCLAVVGASVAGQPAVLQNIQGRFVRGGTTWIVHDLVVLQAGK
jgi:hypothetical protein